jgi:NAD(P)-dependent dehydrogenase (short-subunit alcohol dehydrogenase family)
MKFRIIGESCGIGQATLALFQERGHTRAGDDECSDVMVFCAGHDIGTCVYLLLDQVRSRVADAYVVVTSEHGSIPVGMEYVYYAAVKAAQKMVCKTLVKSGIPCVDVSPAFVIDSGKNKRINRDPKYWETVVFECRGTPPVTSKDVAAACVFAAENIGKVIGSTIRVSAGWRL